MFQIHDIYKPTRPLKTIAGPVRVIDSVGFENVVLIEMDTGSQKVPFTINYREWVELLDSRSLEKARDPFLRLTSAPKGLPDGAANRLQKVIEATSAISQNSALFHSPRTLAKEIGVIASSMGLDPRTVKRWILSWLQAGRNPAVVVSVFIESQSDEKQVASQNRGAKRGRTKTKPEMASDSPAHEVRKKCEKAYEAYVKTQGMIWSDAYYEMLIVLCGIPAIELENSKSGLLMDPVLIEKYRPPTWPQCRYIFRKLKKQGRPLGEDSPRGKRGKATDNVPGPGFYEIDATFFQIQLVSQVTKSKLVGRPTVYLIVDIFDGVIVGYATTLENPSWAVAALALHNCFSDKGETFSRLGLTFTSKDWPCCHLPTMLRADRADLVSNMGMDFPTSGVRVEVTPSMTPIAKGTIEGKNSELKREHPGRFNLPGRFKKVRSRRQSDGKKNAALDILEFERILVEIIMDINGESVDPRKIPPDALQNGAKVASRIGLHEWALVNRAGFTRKMGQHFPYEHLLTKAKGIVTPLGIKLENEIFNCDRLREMGFLLAAVDKNFAIAVSYNPNYAGEIFFYDKENDIWLAAKNTDPEVERYKMTFAEAKEYRAMQNLMAEQAGMNNHVRRRTRMPNVRKAIKVALEEKAALGIKTSTSNANIIENRGDERAAHRSAGLNGFLPTPNSSEVLSSTTATTKSPLVEADQTDATTSASTPSSEKRNTSSAVSLWSRIDATTKR